MASFMEPPFKNTETRLVKRLSCANDVLAENISRIITK